MVYLETGDKQCALKEILKQEGPQISDMCIVVYSRSACVETYLLIV
jgi:hypothetical protein